jgi:multidrug resistance efflux pump
MQSEEQLAAAMSALASLRSGLRQQRLGQEGVVATAEAQRADAFRQAAVYDSLDRKALASPVEVAQARDKARELEARLRVERARLEETTGAEREQLALMRDQVDRLRAIAEAQRRRVASMRVVAEEGGQLQQLPLELGQWVNPGMELARVARPGRLKAVLRVPETQARDVALGQTVRIDTRSGIVAGHVARSDPSSQNGFVTVEVALDGALPDGTRSDQSVDATIEVERLSNVLYTGRPAYGDAGGTLALYRLTPDGREARRVTVRLGRVSADAVVVASGLAEHDRVILSDMSQWDGAPVVRVK